MLPRIDDEQTTVTVLTTSTGRKPIARDEVTEHRLHPAQPKYIPASPE